MFVTVIVVVCGVTCHNVTQSGTLGHRQSRHNHFDTLPGGPELTGGQHHRITADIKDSPTGRRYLAKSLNLGNLSIYFKKATIILKIIIKNIYIPVIVIVPFTIYRA